MSSPSSTSSLSSLAPSPTPPQLTRIKIPATEILIPAAAAAKFKLGDRLDFGMVINKVEDGCLTGSVKADMPTAGSSTAAPPQAHGTQPPAPKRLTRDEELAPVPFVVEAFARYADTAYKVFSRVKGKDSVSAKEKSYLLKRWKHWCRLRRKAYRVFDLSPPLERVNMHDAMLMSDEADGWEPQYKYLTYFNKQKALNDGRDLEAADKLARARAFNAGTKLKLWEKRERERKGVSNRRLLLSRAPSRGRGRRSRQKPAEASADNPIQASPSTKEEAPLDGSLQDLDMLMMPSPAAAPPQSWDDHRGDIPLAFLHIPSGTSSTGVASLIVRSVPELGLTMIPKDIPTTIRGEIENAINTAIANADVGTDVLRASDLLEGAPSSLVPSHVQRLLNLHDRQTNAMETVDLVDQIYFDEHKGKPASAPFHAHNQLQRVPH